MYRGFPDYGDSLCFSTATTLTNNQGGNEYVVQAVPGRDRRHAVPPVRWGGLKPGDAVLLSYDMLGGMVGQVGDGSHVNSYAEPLFLQNMDSLIGWVIASWNVSKIFFGFDEVGLTAKSEGAPLSFNLPRICSRILMGCFVATLLRPRFLDVR